MKLYSIPNQIGFDLFFKNSCCNLKNPLKCTTSSVSSKINQTKKKKFISELKIKTNQKTKGSFLQQKKQMTLEYALFELGENPQSFLYLKLINGV
jgi:hypothetical protein